MQVSSLILVSLFLSLCLPSWASIKPFQKTELLDLEEVFFSNFKSIDKIHIYLDADRSNHFASAHSIELGVNLALSEVDFKLWGKEVEIFLLDHHGNTSRVKRHLKQFLNDKNALVYFSGIHSPPLVKLRDFINENQILSMIPWAAAGPITRYPSRDNYIFRLSVDDTKAGKFIIDYSIQKLTCKKPHLLLENTAWGDSNLKTMKNALSQYGIEAGVTRFNWNLQDITAQSMIGAIVDEGADCIQLVANAIEGEKLVKATAKLSSKQGVSVISHWGIVAGDFHRKVSAEIRNKVNLSFIQTGFSFLQKNLNAFQQDVLNRAIKKYSCIDSAETVRAPNGFIHAYDLTRILIQATKQINYREDYKQLRISLKKELEDLNQPVQGLIREYAKPFKEYSLVDDDAHEALGITDFAMAKFGEDGEVILL